MRVRSFLKHRLARSNAIICAMLTFATTRQSLHKSPMEIFPNVHEIRSVFGDRYIQQYLFVADRIVLLDAGVIATPEAAILPYLDKIGISPTRLSMVVAMHADADHHGGLPAIKDVSRSTLLACHAGDKKLIEDPERLYQDRYNFLSHDHGLGFNREGMVNCPRKCKIDQLLSAGQSIEISPGWNLQVWHVPGHSDGHLAIYDEKNRAAFTSDAVQAGGYPTIDGRQAFGPTYYAVDAYLATIQFLEDQPIDHIFSGHWPASHGKATQRFMALSRDFVEATDELIRGYLSNRSRGATLKEIIYSLSPKLGSWPSDAADFLQFALYGHMVRLEQLGVVRSSKSPIEYALV
jgi:glyoxylase-like metal-dependent hydrolase (beta-lactamase superfamily II)